MRECQAAMTMPLWLAQTARAGPSPSTFQRTERAIRDIQPQIRTPSRMVMGLERNRDFIAPPYTALRHADHELDA